MPITIRGTVGNEFERVYVVAANELHMKNWVENNIPMFWGRNILVFNIREASQLRGLRNQTLHFLVDVKHSYKIKEIYDTARAQEMVIEYGFFKTIYRDYEDFEIMKTLSRIKCPPAQKDVALMLMKANRRT